MYLLKTMMAAAVFCFAAFVHAEVNINTATMQQLTELNNIGSVKAAAIVEYRNDHGRFKTVDDLLKVNGIGMAILEENRNMLTVGVGMNENSPIEKAMSVGKLIPAGMGSPNMDKEN